MGQISAQCDTVGQLIEFLSRFDKDTKLTSDFSNMESCGTRFGVYAFAEHQKYKEVKKSTWDRFDGTDYTYTTLSESEDGDLEGLNLKIR